MRCRNRSHVLLTLCSLFGVGLLSTAAAAQDQGQTVTLRMADHIPVGHDINVHFAKVWRDAVTERTKGRVKFEHYPSEQLGKARDMLSLVLNGVTDVGLLGPSYFAELPLSGVVELPRTSGTACDYTRAFQRILRESDGLLYKLEYGPLGVRPLIPVIFPANQVFSTRKIESVKDLEGQKLQSQGGAKERVIRSLKAVPVPVTNPELFESLSRGTIDGGILATASVASYKLPIKSITRGENFGTATALYAMSEARWKKLPADLQKVLRESGEETGLKFCAFLEKSEEKNYETFKSRGISIVQFSPEDRKLMETNILPIQKEWATSLDKRGKAGTEMFHAYEKALAAK